MSKLRVALAAVFAFAWLLLFPVPTNAGVVWCAEDPILSFSNGTQLQLLVRYDAAQSAAVTDPVLWSIAVPINAGTIVVTVPSNAAHRETVALSYTGGKWGGGTNDIQIHATARVGAASKFALTLEVTGDTSTSPMQGYSNEALTIAAHTHSGDFTPYQSVITGTRYVFTGTGSATLP